MEWMMRERVDLAHSQGLTRWPGQLLQPGDAMAHLWIVSVYRDGESVDLTGWTVTAYMTRQDGACVPVPGMVDGRVAGAYFLPACYACPGTLTGTLQASQGDVRITLARGVWQVGQPSGGTVVDPGDVVPTLEELLAEISAMRTATQACEEATDVAVAMGAAASAIVAEASGAVATMTDASDRPARALVTTIRAAQPGEGNPAPDNVRPLSGRDAASLCHGAAYDEAASPALTAALPETVYGGTLDWVTGVLTVTHRMIQLTGTDAEGWTHNGSQQYYAKRYLMSSPGATALDGYCTHYRYANAFAGIAKSMQGRDNHVWLKDADLTSVDAVKAYLAEQAAAGTPVTLVYPLATPYTVQLAPQRLTLLKGSNAIWSDTGDTAVTYIADTKLYIDDRLAAIAAAAISG